ncbi:Dyp-type peroxidase [Leucothrix pacifica]|uniref:Peroxidase n=1 Tax=Leucothrix pacifica TaxID=1247513 RepID=A0A317C9R6_9GAMM|nr:Dyp-type peroxidase [Leucothrix pacifica]PWQ92802.1 peroxidase [Leucothrix pacifica]
MKHQFGIIDEIPVLARYQYFRLKPGADPRASLSALAEIAVDNDIVVGLGQSLLMALNANIDGMHKMPEFMGKGIEIPTTPHALWCWIRGTDRGDLLHKARTVRQLLADAFDIDHTTDAFKYDKCRDLTGYEDGTENPQGDDGLAAALLASDQDELDGSSFVAVQTWVHDLDKFQAMSHTEQNHTFGRDQESNEELDDAPESAHVKRTAQEDFEPEAFVVRRSMPWANESKEGLVFVAFGKSFDAFEALLNRMIGADDGIIDGLFSFTRPISGSYFWCPPVKDGQLNLAAVL